MKMKFLYIFLIILNSCSGQKNQKITDTNASKEIMEKFDKEQFDSNKVDGEYTFTLKDSSTVRQMENIARLEYVEEIMEYKTPFSKVKVYFMNSGNLKISGERFYETEIGIWKYYDETGKLIKQTDWDAAFKFTLEDLGKKMKAMNVDIFKNEKFVSVDKENEDRPLYIVMYPVGPESPYKVYTLTIDGVDGKTIDKQISSLKH